MKHAVSRSRCTARWALRRLSLLAMLLAAALAPGALAAQLVEGLEGATGSSIGPGGALFVTESIAGRVSRVDPQTGQVTTFVSGLPQQLPWVGVGGAMDIAFIGSTAYVLVTLVGPDVGGTEVAGIYRIDGPNEFEVIADLGQFTIDNPSDTVWFVPSGVHFAIETFRGGFLVTDGHHNRVLQVTKKGRISELIAFGNVVPTGLAVSGNTIYMAQAGPVPHAPEDGRIVRFSPGDSESEAVLVGSGASLMVDVEFGRGRTLFGLSQGDWDGVGEGSPAAPDTGALVRVNADGTVAVVADGLDRPNSVEFIGNTAYILTLGGEVLRIDDLAEPPFGRR